MAPVRASVDRYAFENGRYWYALQAEMEDGRHWSLCRYYEDFYDFQIALIAAFPVEAGQHGDKRTLPYMPGPVTYVTDTISSARRASLDEYIKEIMAMGPRISRHRLVKLLFAPKDGDVETRPPHLQHDSGYAQNRASQASHQSSDSSPGPSRQGSRVDLNGNMRGNGSYPSILSPPPPQQRNTAPGRSGPAAMVAINGQAKEVHVRNNSEAGIPKMNRMDSSLSTNTAVSASSPTSNPIVSSAPASSSFMKVKVHFQDDLIAIRLPSDISLSQLQSRLEQRLDTKLGCLQYRDEATGDYYDLISDRDLSTAIQRNSKLVLSVS